MTSGDDDLFSFDLSLEERKAKLAGISVPVHIIFSGADETVPDHSGIEGFLESVRNASPMVRSSLIIPDAAHAVANPKGISALVKEVCRIIQQV